MNTATRRKTGASHSRKHQKNPVSKVAETKYKRTNSRPKTGIDELYEETKAIPVEEQEAVRRALIEAGIL